MHLILFITGAFAVSLRTRDFFDLGIVTTTPEPGISAGDVSEYKIEAKLNVTGTDNIVVLADEQNMSMCNCASGSEAALLGCPPINNCIPAPTNPPAI